MDESRLLALSSRNALLLARSPFLHVPLNLPTYPLVGGRQLRVSMDPLALRAYQDLPPPPRLRQLDGLRALPLAWFGFRDREGIVHPVALGIPQVDGGLKILVCPPLGGGNGSGLLVGRFQAQHDGYIKRRVPFGPQCFGKHRYLVLSLCGYWIFCRCHSENSTFPPSVHSLAAPPSVHHNGHRSVLRSAQDVPCRAPVADPLAETQSLYSPVSSMSSHSSSSERLSLPRLETLGNSSLQPYCNNSELSALSCSSEVSQIIGQYLYTPLTATPERYEHVPAPGVQLFWEEKKETVEDMIYALDRVLGMAPGSNARRGTEGTEKRKETPTAKPVAMVEKKEGPPVVEPVAKAERQQPHWGAEKESVEDMINALNRAIERGGMGTPSLDGYTPLTATTENFRLDIQAEPEEVKRQFRAKGRKEEPPKDTAHNLSRMLSVASMDVPVALEELLYEHAQGQGMLLERRSGVRRGSKAPVSSRLSELRGIQTGKSFSCHSFVGAKADVMYPKRSEESRNFSAVRQPDRLGADPADGGSQLLRTAVSAVPAVLHHRCIHGGH